MRQYSLFSHRKRTNVPSNKPNQSLSIGSAITQNNKNSALCQRLIPQRLQFHPLNTQKVLSITMAEVFNQSIDGQTC